MRNRATTATLAQPLQNGCALSRRHSRAQPAQPRPYRECGEGCAPPALSLRRLGAPTLRASYPSSPSDVRPNQHNEHRTDSNSDHRHDGESTSSVPQLIDIRPHRSPTSRCGIDRSDQQSMLLLASWAIGLVSTRIFAIAEFIVSHWEWHGKTAIEYCPLCAPRSLAKPGNLAIFAGLSPRKGGYGWGWVAILALSGYSTFHLPTRRRAENFGSSKIRAAFCRKCSGAGPNLAAASLKSLVRCHE